MGLHRIVASLVLLSASGHADAACVESPSATVTNRGDVMRSPRVHFVFWGSYWLSPDGSAAADLAVRSYSRVSPAYFGGLAQYGAGTPTLAGMMTASNYEPPAYVTFGDAAILLQSLVNSHTIPSPSVDREMYYLVMLPPASTVPYRAYHDSVIFSDGMEVQAAFVSSGDSAISDMLHELVEGITDPRGHGVRVQLTQPKGELADACESICSVYHVSGVQVPAYWSVADGACVAPGSLRVRGNDLGVRSVRQYN